MVRSWSAWQGWEVTACFPLCLVACEEDCPLLDLPPWSELTGLADGRMNLAAPLVFGKL